MGLGWFSFPSRTPLTPFLFLFSCRGGELNPAGRAAPSHPPLLQRNLEGGRGGGGESPIKSLLLSGAMSFVPGGGLRVPGPGGGRTCWSRCAALPACPFKSAAPPTTLPQARGTVRAAGSGGAVVM